MNLLKELPRGVQDYLPEECGVKRGIEQELRKIFLSNGYREVATPAFEYYNVFSGGTGSYKEQHMIKFFDRDGRILALRPDITVPIARMAATSMPEENTLRLFYIQNAYQLFDGNIRQKSEHTQAGVEFFGRGGSGADSEIIALAIKTLLSLGLRDFKVDIGQAGFFKGLIADSGIGEERAEELKNLIDFKNTVELEYALSQMDIGAETKKKLMALPELFGGREALAFAEELAAGELCEKALENLREIYEMLCDMGYENYISIDLGMLHDIEYYSGVIFRGLISEVGFPVLSGGRYDGLAGKFGKDRPAIGFALDLKRAMTALDRQGGLKTEQREVIVVTAEKKAAGDGARYAEELRSRGKTAVFEIEPDGAMIEEYKQDRCVSQIVKICGGGTKILYERGAI